RARLPIQAPPADPIATPRISAAIVPANAYVVGPIVIASTRVQTISNSIEANPDRPSAAAASHVGIAGAIGSDRLGMFFGGRFGAGSPVARGKLSSRDARTRTTPAAIALTATPSRIDPETPAAGINRKPDSRAPAAAPPVFNAYRIPPLRAGAAPLRFVNHRTAIGNVAPSATAGAS